MCSHISLNFSRENIHRKGWEKPVGEKEIVFLEHLLFKMFNKHDQASVVAQMVKNLPAVQETCIGSLGQEDSLEKEMATHSSILAWRIPWTEEPGGLSPWGRKELDTTEGLTQYTISLTLTGSRLLVIPILIFFF